jgi:hypothetical protein
VDQVVVLLCERAYAYIYFFFVSFALAYTDIPLGGLSSRDISFHEQCCSIGILSYTGCHISVAYL